MGISVHPVGPDDVDELVASVAELFQEDAGQHDPFTDLEWPSRYGARYYGTLVNDRHCLLMLARDSDLDNQVVGHLVGKLGGPDAMGTVRFAVLESMRVRPESRSRGIGALLVAEFFAWARERGARQATVTAFAGNDGARRFYARHGFAPHLVTLRMPV
jgi:GNAT superfamily N-acetyltransferase